MGHWWNDTDEGQLTYFERNLSQYYCFEGTSHMDWPGIEPRPPKWQQQLTASALSQPI